MKVEFKEGNGVKLSKKMSGMIDTINNGKKGYLQCMNELSFFANDVWKMLHYARNSKNKVVSIFNTDMKKRNEYVACRETVWDVATAAAILYTHNKNVYGRNYWVSFVKDYSSDVHEAWNDVINHISITKDDNTVVSLSELNQLLFMPGLEDEEAPKPKETKAKEASSKKNKTEDISDPIETLHPEDDRSDEDIVDGVYSRVKEEINQDNIGKVIQQNTSTSSDNDGNTRLLTDNENSKKAETNKPEEKKNQPQKQNVKDNRNSGKKAQKPVQKEEKAPVKENDTVKKEESTVKKDEAVDNKKPQTPSDIKLEVAEKEISFTEAMSSLITIDDGKTKQDLVQENAKPITPNAIKKNNARYGKLHPEIIPFTKLMGENGYHVKYSNTNVKAYVHDDYRMIYAQIYDTAKGDVVNGVFIDPNEYYMNGYNVMSSTMNDLSKEDCVSIKDTKNVLKLVRKQLTDADREKIYKATMPVSHRAVFKAIDFRPAKADIAKLNNNNYSTLVVNIDTVGKATGILYGELVSVTNGNNFEMLCTINNNAGIPEQFNLEFNPTKYGKNAYSMNSMVPEEQSAAEA